MPNLHPESRLEKGCKREINLLQAALKIDEEQIVFSYSLVVFAGKRGRHSSFLIQNTQVTHLEDRQILWNFIILSPQV